MKIALVQGVVGLWEKTSNQGDYPALKKKHLEELASPGTEIEILHPNKGPESVETTYDEYVYAPGILEKIMDAEKAGFDAAIIGCFGDPALHAAREIVKMPVVGTGQASMLLAMSLGDYFSIISPLSSSVALRNARIYGVMAKLASVRTITLPVLELYGDHEKTNRIFVEEARAAIDVDGADVIVPGCGHFSTLARELGEELGVPVIDPGGAALKLAETLAALKISQSKKAYPQPREKRRKM